MENSEYRLWTAVDIKGWGPRPGAAQARVQRALESIMNEALQTMGLRLEQLPINKQGDGLLLPIPGHIPKTLVTTTFVDSLVDRLDDHNDASAESDEIRVRLALHAGDGVDGDGHWSGDAVVHVCRLVNAGGVRRTLAAAEHRPLALIVSDHWYDAVIRQRYAPASGYREIGVHDEGKGFFANAWVRVPGLTHPPGLIEDDDARPRPPRTDPSRAAGADGDQGGARFTINASTVGDVFNGDKTVYHLPANGCRQ